MSCKIYGKAETSRRALSIWGEIRGTANGSASVGFTECCNPEEAAVRTQSYHVESYEDSGNGNWSPAMHNNRSQ